MTAQQYDRHADRVRLDIAFDVWNEATAMYWRRRAETLRWARPRPGDFHGKATREELNARWCELTELAHACENRARVALLGGATW